MIAAFKGKERPAAAGASRRPWTALAAGALLLACGSLARAEPLDETGAWALFTELCGAIVENPSAARALVPAAGGEVKLGTTADGWTSLGSGSFTDRADDHIPVVGLNFASERHAGLYTGWCQLQAVGTGGSKILPEIETIFLREAPALLGAESMRRGGPIIGADFGRGRAWAQMLPGTPPPKSIRLQIFDRLVMLTMTRAKPVEGN
ncbi:MAG: hypothetical protein ACFBRM_15900 [Pikeienuella sp.]